MAQSKTFYRDLNKNYPTATYGKGIYIYDNENKAYLDGSSGALVANLGHGQDEIVEAMYAQMKQISFAHTSQFKTDVLEEYSERLSQIAPGDINYTYFVSGGSEAIETAVKMARQYQIERGKPSKYKVITRWTSFHGHTLGTLSLGGYASWREPQDPNLIDFPHINPPNCYHCPFGLQHPECQTQCALDLENMILREGPETVSAFLFEPVIGSSASAVIAPDSYFEKVAEICKKYDILLIADEVMSGFGRTGEFFAGNHWQLKPDMIACGKGISSGYAPLGAVLVHKKIYETFKEGSGKFLHGFTFSGNPVSASAGLAVLKYMQNHNIMQHVQENEDYLRESLFSLMEQYDFIGDVRGKGMMWGVEFVRDKKTREMFSPNDQITSQIVKEAFDNQLIVYPSQKFHFGKQGDSILIAPPLIITKNKIDELIHKLTKTLVGGKMGTILTQSS